MCFGDRVRQHLFFSPSDHPVSDHLLHLSLKTRPIKRQADLLYFMFLRTVYGIGDVLGQEKGGRKRKDGWVTDYLPSQQQQPICRRRPTNISFLLYCRRRDRNKHRVGKTSPPRVRVDVNRDGTLGGLSVYCDVFGGRAFALSAITYIIYSCAHIWSHDRTSSRRLHGGVACRSSFIAWLMKCMEAWKGMARGLRG